jgi:hypothetical protein
MLRASKFRGRWLSYSLRSLLLLVSRPAIVLAWVAYERRQSARELQIAKRRHR